RCQPRQPSRCRPGLDGWPQGIGLILLRPLETDWYDLTTRELPKSSDSSYRGRVPYVRCRACGRRSRVRRERLGSAIRCPRCSATSVAQVSLFHAAHPSGLIIGWVAILLAIAGAA